MRSDTPNSYLAVVGHSRSRKVMSNGLQDRREHAQAELALHIGEIKSPDMVGSLWNGLMTLQKLLLTRLHIDFAAEFGVDSSLAPATAGEAIRETRHAAEAIETYSLVLAIDEVAPRICQGRCQLVSRLAVAAPIW